MLDTLVTIGVFLVGLTVLIVIHELGHYWAARIFGIRVEAFALFWGKKLIGFKRGDTEWQLNLIPIGGYVKITGMLDESLDEEQVQGDPEPWEFRSKPTWQRLIVMLGGIIMNVVLGILIFVILKYTVGDNKIPIENVKYGLHVTPDTPASELGFQTGDKVLTYQGDSVKYFNEAADPNNLVDSDKYYEVMRNGKVVRIDVADDYMNSFVDFAKAKKASTLFDPDTEAFLIVPDTAMQRAGKEEEVDISIHAWEAGLRNGDKVVGVDSVPIRLWSDFFAMKRQKETTYQLTVEREGKPMTFSVKTDTAGKFGVGQSKTHLYKQIEYSFVESIPVGIEEAWSKVTGTVKGLGMLFTGNADPTKSLSGPVKIAQIYGKGFSAGGWTVFWGLTAYLSMVLAVMNLLPIPVLDGGQILILTLEAVMGREIPAKPKMWILQISFYFVIGLMLLIVLNDIIN